MNEKWQKFESDAWGVLDRNDRGDHTIPSSGMYGKDLWGGQDHQKAWLWDNAFHARGLMHRDPLRAAEELDYMFEAQWQNGMIPHMRFAKFSIDRVLWSSRFLNKNAPKRMPTSGITQPPVMAESAQLVADKMDSESRERFIMHAFPYLVRYHQWIYNERNEADNGLFSVVHPWETGMDNSPIYMVPMRSMEWGRLGSLVHFAYNHIAHRFRPDLRYAPPSQRASADEGTLISKATASLIRNRYDHKRLDENHPIKIEDVHMSSILIANNRAIAEMSEEYKLPIDDELMENMRKTPESLESLYDEQDKLYYSRDVRTGELIRIPTSGSIMPLYAGTSPTDRIDALASHLQPGGLIHSAYPVPSVSPESQYYQQDNYWHSTWVNMNRLIATGLYLTDNAEYIQQAEDLELSTLNMVQQNGFYESFSPETGRGLGETEFSWTAALSIDILRRLIKRRPELLER